MRLYLLDADYISEDNGTTVRLFGVNEDGESVCVLDESRPYLYAVPDEVTDDLKERISSLDDPEPLEVREVERTLGGEERTALQVFVPTPPDTGNMRDELKDMEEIGHGGCYEYNMNHYKRYLIDNDLEPGNWYDIDEEEVERDWEFTHTIRVSSISGPADGDTPSLKTLAFDLESYEEGGDSEIVMLSFWKPHFKRVYTYRDGEYPEYVEVLEDEEEVLEEFVDVVDRLDPDVLVTYNGDEFDFQLLRERAEHYGIELDIGRDGGKMYFERRMRTSAARLTGRVHLDLYQFVQRILRYHLDTETYGLGPVASEVLDEEKEDMAYEELREIWRQGKELERLAEYNLRDSELAYRLSQSFIPQLIEFSRVIGQPLFDTSRMAYSQLVEWYMMKRSHEMGYISPNQPRYEEVQERRRREPFTGGFVKEPVSGLHEDIAVMDFRSLYPSIIATHNISPETLNCEDGDEGHQVPDSDHHFCSNREGFYSTVVQELMEERFRLKDRMEELDEDSSDLQHVELEERVLKMLANASYGALAYVGAKWYCYECASSASSWGRHYISHTIEDAESFGFTVLYADTDSCFVTIDNDLEGSVDQFLSQLNEDLPDLMRLDLEGIYERGLFVPKEGKGTAKKKYALVDTEGNMTVKGLETVRRDWCRLAKRVQEKILEYVLVDRDKEGALDHIEEVIDRVKNKEIDVKDMTIQKKLGKDIDEYKSKSPHVEAARKIKERGRPYSPGMIVIYVITEGEGSISDRAEPVEDARPEDIDPEYYIENQIIPAAMRVLQVMDIREEDIEHLDNQKTIKRFTD